jgi:hypothetical protein
MIELPMQKAMISKRFLWMHVKPLSVFFTYVPSNLDRLSSSSCLCGHMVWHSSVEGTYVKKTDNGFTCIHKNLFDIIAFCIGSSIIRTVLKHGSSSFIKERLQFKSLNVKHDPLTIMLPPENEDLYFQRLLIDMKKGLVWDVFSSLQSTFPEFREKLIAYMQKH